MKFDAATAQLAVDDIKRLNAAAERDGRLFKAAGAVITTLNRHYPPDGDEGSMEPLYALASCTASLCALLRVDTSRIATLIAILMDAQETERQRLAR